MKLSTRKILHFTKIEHTVFSLPLVFAGVWLGAGHRLPSLRNLVLLVLAGVGARVLGISMNRILDRTIDAKNPRTSHRELLTGAISLPVALVIAAWGCLVYELACFMLGPLVFALSPVPAALLIGYSLLKRFTPLCHFGIGLAFRSLCAFSPFQRSPVWPARPYPLCEGAVHGQARSGGYWGIRYVDRKDAH